MKNINKQLKFSDIEFFDNIHTVKKFYVKEFQLFIDIYYWGNYFWMVLLLGKLRPPSLLDGTPRKPRPLFGL